MHQSISRYIYKMYKCDYILLKIHPTTNIGVYTFVHPFLCSLISCSLRESSAGKELSLWSWPRPRHAWSSASKPKTFCMSIKVLSQKGKHQDVSQLSWPESWWNILAKRQVGFFFSCLGPFSLGKRRHQEETDRKGMEEYSSWSPEENGD